jgi:hypothetical protein
MTTKKSHFQKAGLKNCSSTSIGGLGRLHFKSPAFKSGTFKTAAFVHRMPSKAELLIKSGTF